jgi:predicted nucleic acid-binding protein
MVLVDTSIWIRSFANLPSYTGELARLADLNEIAGHALVYGEILIGDRGGRDRFLQDYLRLYQAPTIPHAQVVELVRIRRLHGRGVSWIDVHLLASALVERMRLWTADESLWAAARELGIAHQEPRPTLVHSSGRAKGDSEQG